MKQRSRIIKPEFFQNRKLAEMSAHHRLLFIGLWTIADRDGKLQDDSALIRAMVFPFEDIGVEKLLIELAVAGFIERYNGGEYACIIIPKFSAHQSPHWNESKSQLPDSQGLPLKEPIKPLASSLQVSKRESKSRSKREREREDKREDCFSPSDLKDLFNEVLAPPLDKVKILRPESKRLKDIKTRLKEHPDKKFWEHIYKVVSESDWLSGRKGGWKADFNWLLNPNRLEEIYEGKYDNNPIMTAQEENRHYKRRENS